jgi:anthranilate synthase component 1
VRAMEIIDTLEPARRGPYAGAVGYFDRGGDMEMCIAIRTLMARPGRVSAQAGAGIVYDSVPASEYQETVNKARALFTAVAQAEERLLASGSAHPSISRRPSKSGGRARRHAQDARTGKGPRAPRLPAHPERSGRGEVKRGSKAAAAKSKDERKRTRR